jgi:uncharacterized protein (TIGR00255 family)
MRSMTGYGEAQGANDRWSISLSLRGVNHRFFDLQLRLPEAARSSETALRELIGKEISRGRVDLRVELQPLVEREARVVLNLEVVREVHRAVGDLVSQGLVDRGLSAGDLLRIPEAFRVERTVDDWSEEEEELFLLIARRALAQFVAGREREGGSLAAILGDRLNDLERIVTRVVGLREGVRDELLAALRRRLSELRDSPPVDEMRLAQEVALLVDRADVSEELDRLGSHVEHFRGLLSEKGAVGKRLDFLSQEVFRELNTLGSKGRNAELTRAVLDAKVICEQLREQVQNVE